MTRTPPPTDSLWAACQPRQEHPRQAEINRAIANAGDGWARDATRAVIDFARKVNRPFISDEATEAATIAGLSEPPQGAWGGVYQRLSRAGLIRKTGGASPRVNGNLAPLWVWAGGGA